MGRNLRIVAPAGRTVNERRETNPNLSRLAWIIATDAGRIERALGRPFCTSEGVGSACAALDMLIANAAELKAAIARGEP